MIIGMVSCETAPKNTQQPTTVEKRKVVDFTTVEGVKSGIEGTVWTYTEPATYSNPFWYKLEFKDGNAYRYVTTPSKGNWGEPDIYSYSIEESRYFDTGKKYVGVKFSMDTFVPSTRVYNHIIAGQLKMKKGDYIWN